MANENESKIPQIPAFYAGRNIFITGGTGFMGKVLIQRLLVTCPDIGRIYLLIRFKKNVSPIIRLQELKKCQVFDVIRNKCPWQLDKLRVLEGDLTQPNFGLTLESLTSLYEVSVVFHNAATLKFDEHLRIAVDINLRSVIQILDICDKLPRIEAFVYVSTAYSNSERSEIDETVYPSPSTLEELFNFLHKTPEPLIKDRSKTLLRAKPNTYTFTKSMAESVIAQRTNGKYRTAIFRPSIVGAALKHPFPGWIENLNGPSGLIVGCGKGVLHTIHGSGQVIMDLIPVDIAIDTLIAVAWDIATVSSQEVRVYNCSVIENAITNQHFRDMIFKTLKEYPLGRPIWYPFGFFIKNRYIFKTIENCLQTYPLYIVAYVSTLFGMKTSDDLISVSGKISAMNRVLNFFLSREWKFEVNNFKKLRNKLTKADAAIFNLDPKTIDWDEYSANYVKGTRSFLIKLNDKRLRSDRKYLKKLQYLHYSVLLLVSIFVLRLCSSFYNAKARINVLKVIFDTNCLKLKVLNSYRDVAKNII